MWRVVCGHGMPMDFRTFRTIWEARDCCVVRRPSYSWPHRLTRAVPPLRHRDSAVAPSSFGSAAGFRLSLLRDPQGLVFGLDQAHQGLSHAAFQATLSDLLRVATCRKGFYD